MYSAEIIVFLGGLVIAMAETAGDEVKLGYLIRTCADDNNIASGDLNNIEENLKNPSNNMLCFMKCIADHDGSLDENGRMNPKNLDMFLNAMKFDDKVVDRVKACALNVPPIKECKDMKALSDCFPEFL